jgi:hypothetical protein
MKYYYKLITKQDVTKSFVLNQRAVQYFFNLALIEHGDEDIVKIEFNDSLLLAKVILHQDTRLLLQNRKFQEGEIAFFTKKNDGHFLLEIINEITMINRVKINLNNQNFYLSNTIIEL